MRRSVRLSRTDIHFFCPGAPRRPSPLTPMLADDARAKVLIEHWLEPDGQTEFQFSGTVPNSVTAKAKPSARASQSRRKSGKTRNATPPSVSI